MKAKTKTVGPTVTLDKKKHKIQPAGKIHARGKKHKGFVIFNALSPCSILFTNPAVFGRQFLKFTAAGQHKYSTRINKGHTLVMLAGGVYNIPKSLGAASNPTDIIVP